MSLPGENVFFIISLHSPILLSPRMELASMLRQFSILRVTEVLS